MCNGARGKEFGIPTNVGGVLDDRNESVADDEGASWRFNGEIERRFFNGESWIFDGDFITISSLS